RNVEKGYINLCILVDKIINIKPVSPENVYLFNQMDEIRKKYSALSPAKINIRNATTQPITTQTFTGKAITPIPEAIYENRELTFAVDFNLTYRNNINVGEATVIMHGKGRFKGQHERKFNVASPSPSEGGDVRKERM
ncbi:MAG: hypothetical protein LBT24_00615, partial [Tannerella sp.]|nr:hypothetical protein [Tannerella sp.]